MKTLLIGSLVALSMGGAAMAQDAQRGHRAADTDTDGRVSQSEFVAAALQRFDRTDANHDGTLTGEEVRAAMQAQRQARRERMFSRLDADGDGSISRAEFDARPERRAEGEPGGGRGGHRGGHRGGRRGGAGAELAGDGITRAEAQARAEARFARMDRNQDGFLSQEDRPERRRGRDQGASSQ